MGAKPITQSQLDERKTRRANPGAEPFDPEKDNPDNRFATDLKRGLLAALTVGTSEIKTGSGEYGDETVADALFPKEVNNILLDDREKARRVTDAAKADAAKKAQPGPVPDLADKLLQRAGAQDLMRQKAKAGRKSTFLSGGG
jgi:hypothetical protein